MRNQIIPYNPKLKMLARELRKNSTLTEVLIWKNIKQRGLGVQFHRQVPMLNYIVDFYCHEIKLVIEIDGSSHDFKEEKDMTRQKELEAYGVKFIRFSTGEVLNQMFGVLLTIEQKIEELAC